MPAVLTSHAYGKSRVRLTRVTRSADRHEVQELTVDVQLDGEFEASYTVGDNSRIIATDTLKNVVYSLAQGRPAEPIEAFGASLASHFLEAHAHVRAATIRIVEQPWSRVKIDGHDHPHAFVGGSGEVRTATLIRDRGGLKVESGLDGLDVLKTTGSGFSGFLRDRHTTLPETADRIFATAVRATWTYAAGPGLNYDAAHALIRRALLETFATHESLSVQQTLHAMGAAALDACPEVSEIALTLPNKHRLLVDLERFGQANVNEVFVAVDEPFGLISGTLRRG